MNILATQYSLQTKSLEIYLAGCKGNPHCPNCHNPESWDFNLGQDWKCLFPSIETKLETFSGLIDNVMIMGGEPLDQPKEELELFLTELSFITFAEKIWLFTRYEPIQVPEFVREYCHYIKCGRYIEEIKTEDNTQHGIKLASLNQNIYKKGVDY